ncbi:MAG: MerR family transcriptional regulator [Candidatus Eisenbacteria bacterium]|uniref:MerR family transcriptional regulator n=1 Tax=Eiseniibacteriota bacterium TaxID=2212470 RepID=A0A538U6V4_UNCEI|nr:MAG: MerR family transcriptional regulator [Candidatus Eisenbacteria bacterium]
MRKGMSQTIENTQVQGGMLRVGDLARMTGKTVRAIHLYEELGLLKPAVDRVRWIDLLHGMGFSLQEMKDVLRAWWGAELGPEAMGRLRSLFQAKLEETRAAIERGRRTEAELLAGLAYLETCKVCSTHEPSSGCVHCTQDHGMKAEPSLVAGITSAPHGGSRRGMAGFVRASEIGKELESR